MIARNNLVLVCICLFFSFVENAYSNTPLKSLLDVVASKQEAPTRDVKNAKLLQNMDSVLYFEKVARDAKKFLYLNFLSITCDHATEKLLSIVKSKAKEKIDVRIIVNKGFSYLSYSCLSDLRESGVKIVKSKTHSSYMLNDQSQLLVGSQSIARMFFLSNGKNKLDRDMMLYLEGNIMLDALRDFLANWNDAEENIELIKSDIKNYASQIRPNNEKSEHRCLWISERPEHGSFGFQDFLHDALKNSKKNIFMSGVFVEVKEDSSLFRLLSEKNKEGVRVRYLGNGHSSGNGELTMVLVEWSQAMVQKGYRFLEQLISKINAWDMNRIYKVREEIYRFLKEKLKIEIYLLNDFLHYKVFLFDDVLWVGSGNLDEGKLGKVSESGVACESVNLMKALESEIENDIKNSNLY